MNQTKLESLLESLVNVAIGAGVAFVSQWVIFPLYDIHVSTATHVWIVWWFTMVSVARSYVLRRFFNAGLHKAISRLSRWGRVAPQQPLLWPSVPGVMKEKLLNACTRHAIGTTDGRRIVAVLPAGTVWTEKLKNAVVNEWQTTGKTVSEDRVKELARD